MSSRTDLTQAQEGNSLSDRAPALNFSLTCELLSTQTFFMMTEDHQDTTQPVFLYFTTEAKPAQTPCSWIHNISSSCRKYTLSARRWGLYCLLVTKKGTGTFILLLHISHLFCGKVSWENSEAKSNADTFAMTNTFPELPLLFIVTFRSEYSYTIDWLVAKQVSASTIYAYQSMLLWPPTQLCSRSYTALPM